LDTGLSGKILIHILPVRFNDLERQILAASIWRAVIQQGSSAISPWSPKSTRFARVALPLIRPRIARRYFTRFGINIA